MKLTEQQTKDIEAGVEEFKVVIRKLVGSTGLSFEFLRHHTAGLLSEQIAALSSNHWNMFRDGRPGSDGEMWKEFKKQKDYKKKLEMECRAQTVQQTKAQKSKVFKKLKQLWKKNVSYLLCLC